MRQSRPIAGQAPAGTGDGGSRRRRAVADGEHVAGREGPALVAAEAAEGEGGPAAEHHGHVEPAPHGDVGAQPGAASAGRARSTWPAPTSNGCHARHGAPVEVGVHVGAAEAHDGRRR